MAVCLGLIATATQGEAIAAHSAYAIRYLRGKGEDGEPFLMSDGIGVGYGARPFADGNDAVYLRRAGKLSPPEAPRAMMVIWQEPFPEVWIITC